MDDTQSENLHSFSFVRGSDPRVATCRGKLQNKRCKLNQEINKELRLRAGAENLYKATTNRKLKDTVALELSFVNSNLQLLKEQLSELNSSVEVYQNDSGEPVIPMIPLGLKETKDVNFMEAFSDFILEHYSEDSLNYEHAIADIVDTRQAARTPSRDIQGVSLLFRYYNLLYYVERRFFPPDRSLGIYFEWYDSLTGVPSCQRTVAFEKACVLFNMGAIYTQIGARQDRSSEKGLDSAVDSFLRAAGVFRHIYDTFTNAPSMDLKPQVLEVLVNLNLAQARECLFEKLLLQMESMSLKDNQHLHRDLSGEATQLMVEYNGIHNSIQSNDTHTYLPECWAGLVPLKAEFYKAMAHFHAAKSITIPKPSQATSPDKQQLKKLPLNKTISLTSSTTSTSSLNSSMSSSMSISNASSTIKRSSKLGKGANEKDTFIMDDSVSSTYQESEDEAMQGDPITMKRAHLKESLASHEDAQRLQRMCRELKNKSALTKVLSHTYAQAEFENERLMLVAQKQNKGTRETLSDDLFLMETPQLNPSTKFTLSLTGPDFTNYKVDDPFKRLGPIAIFSARRHWTAPRSVRLQKGNNYDSSKAYLKTHLNRVANTCHCKRSICGSYDPGLCEICSKYINMSEGMGRSDKEDQEAEGEDVNGERFDKNNVESFGFHVRGDAPVIISYVEINSLADLAGIKEGDFIVEIAGIDVKWYTHQEIVNLIQTTGSSCLEMKIITPMDRNYLKPVAGSGVKGSITTLSGGSSSGVSSGAPSPTSTTSKPKSRNSKSRLGTISTSNWNPFRRTQSMGKIF